jgi:hypothetical protein
MAAGAAELLLAARREYDELSRVSGFGGVSMKIVHLGLLMLLAAPLACASATAAQTGQQQDALAAAARRAREQQKTQPKAAKVWDNDNIPTAGGVNVVGQAAPAELPSAKTPETSAKEAAPKESAEEAKKKKSDLDANLKAAKDNLNNLETDLDFAQRKYALDQQSFYQNPNYSSDTSGAAALQDEENQIDAKKQDVQAAKDKIADLEAKLASSTDSGSNSNDNSAK